MGFIDAPNTDDDNTAAYSDTVGWVLLMLLALFILTRSYAALRAEDLD